MENDLRTSNGTRYWLNEIEDSIESEKFLCDYNNDKYQLGKYSITIDSKLGCKLKSLCKDNNFLMYSFLLASMKINLSKYMSKKCVTVGIPFYNIKGTRKIAYSRVLPLTSNVGYEDTYKEYMVSIKNKMSEIYKNQESLTKTVLLQSKVCKDIMDLTPISICMRNFHEDKYINYITNSSKNEISFLLELMDDRSIKLDVLYNMNKVSENTINNLSRTFIKVLDEVLNNPNKKISDIDILSENEKNKILYDFNNTNVEYPKNKTIQELFEEQVEKNPESNALVFEDKSMTYKELNEKSNQLARVLRSKGVKRDSIVGLITDRSLEMIMGILAVLKAGGAYLPIDPGYPKERIEYILNDSRSEVLLTTDEFLDEMEFEKQVINLSDEKYFTESVEKLEKINDSSSLAYVIYTSGTTGNPKGVMIEHKSVVNYLLYSKENYCIEKKLNMPLYTSVAFDLTVTSIFTPLISGNTMVIYKEKELDKLINKVLAGNEESVIKITPAHLSLLKEMNYVNKSIKRFIVGGEDLTEEVAKSVSDIFDDKVDIINEYGPTEATVGCVVHRYNPKNKYRNSVLIGAPINNTKIYILDKESKLLPIGVAGELCIGGDVLARGYLNRPELTAEKFVDNPFANGKMYKTGDLARWLPDGNIEFLGRLDNQVKIRGFRIEIGEIEKRIVQHENIKEAAVLVVENDEKEKSICAYVVSEQEINKTELKSYLKETLPEYMIPSYFIKLEEMPLTINGKVDRRALPKPNLEERITRYEAPRNAMEETLVKIWGEVLGRDKIGINDSFFELGGHSLKAMVLISKIHKETNKEIPLKEIFKSPTIKGLSKFIEEIEENIYLNIENTEDKEYYEASSAQKRMYVIQGFDKESLAYNMPQVFELQGSIDKAKIEYTFKKLVERHEALRTYFKTVEDEIVQKIDNDYEFKLKEQTSHKSIEKLIDDFIKPFDLGNAPLFRVEILETMGKNYLLIDMHHIISDGVSMNVLIREFASLYNGEGLEPLKLQYKDFSAWQNNFLKSEEMKKQEEYWINMFNDEIPVLNMPTDYERPSIQSFQGDSVSFVVDRILTNKLKELTKNTETTMYMVLLAAFNILLSKYSGQEDIIIGTPIAGRPHSDLQNIIGMFVNTLALRNKPEGNKKYIDFLNEVKENSIKAYENQSYQLETLIEKLDIVRDTSRNPLFDIMFSMGEALDDNNIELNGLSLKPYDLGNKISKFDLSLNALEDGEELKFGIEYCLNIFKNETIQRLIKHYVKILENIADNKEIIISEINMLTEEEETQLLYEFNNTKENHPKDKTIQELFEEQVEKTPDNTAVVFEEEKLTYRELNEKANRLARVLRSKGVKSDSVIGIMVEKSLEMAIGIMAVLKSGGAYLPIDASYPKERIEYIINDSKCSLILSNKDLPSDIEFNGEIIGVLHEEISGEDLSNLDKINSLNDLAYIIYTSGTTGNPKGVMIEHKNLRAYVDAFLSEFNLNSGDVVLQQATYCFDGFVDEFYPILLVGGKLVICSKYDALDMNKLESLVLKHKISLISCSPLFLNELNKCKNITSIKTFISGGDVLKESYFNNLITYANVYNTYGPTETTVCSNYYKCNESNPNNIPIGKPISGYKVYVLDKHLNLLPIGVTGELYIAGQGVARGYLNKPVLTKEKFINNPFEVGTKMYKTGDLVTWTDSGDIKFIGRVDEQVKIRGFRIELPEIENKILQHESIKEAVVLVKETEENEKYICAYVVSEKGIKELNLRNYLKESLPEYMIPSYFVPLDKMPITSNGKIDRKSLPKPNLDEKSTIYEAPRNELEEGLVRIWNEVLGVDKIGINDSFFELGGHSLRAMALISKIHKETNKEIPLKELFKNPTIKGLSKFIESAKEDMYSNIEKTEEKEYYEASSAQKRMYIVQSFDKENVAYNMPQVFEIQGNINKDRIKYAFKELVGRHEALRTYFETVEDEIVQKIDNNYEFKLKERISEQSIEAVSSDFVKPFDLGNAPLFRAEIVESHDKNYLLIDMHHIISDGVSMSVLIMEFASLYNGEELEPLKLQYKDFSTWQNNFLKSEEMKKQEEYWINMFSDEIPVLNMISDHERPAVQSFQGNSISFELDKNIGFKLKELTKKTGTTMHMVLLSAFNILLSKYSGQEDIIIGTPIAGRPHADLQNIMGMFVNTLALRNKPEGNKKYIDFLNEVKENSIKAYENQSYQLETLIEKLDIVRDTSRNPLFDIMFSMGDTLDDNDIELNGLSLKPYDLGNKISKFDLSLNALEDGEDLKFDIEYCSEIFNKETIQRLIKHYVKILDNIADNKEITISEINMLTQEEETQILYEFNNTKKIYPQDKTIQQLFEEQVEKTPDNIAVVFEEKNLTYRELNEKANHLAEMLINKGVKADSIVSIMVEKSFEMIVAIMGILKSGAAYLPIDPSYPKERIEYMLKDSQSKILLTREGLVDLNCSNVEIVDLYDNNLFNGDSTKLQCISKSTNLAYILYTSGSTGEPKGVMVEHRGVINLLNWFNKEYKLDEESRVLQATNYTFDVSIEEIFGALLSGASLYLVDLKQLISNDGFKAFIDRNRITMAQFVPSTLEMIIENKEKFNSLNVLICGGEKLDNTLKNKVLAKGYKLFNHYGPTEITVDAITTKCYEGYTNIIGRPIQNTQIYILSRSNEIVPIGVPGEICIAGSGIARGYLNKPELTEEKFVDNPFELSTKMYRTGDLGKWLSDGTIEFIGRIDNQVKIRGFRIELGDIESKLLQHVDVKEAVVMLKEYKERCLCAYIVSEKKLDEINLKAYLKECLPEYMIPSYFIQLDKMPTTHNGKIDRKALPKPNLDERLTSYEAPRNELEEVLSRIWSEVLEIQKIGINDSFFELGGHSLKAMTLISKIHKKINKEVTLKELFKSPTIKGLSKFIDEAKENVYSNIEKIEEKSYYEASSAQKRMYAIQGFDKNSIAYNMPEIFEIQGSIDKAKIEYTFKKLVDRHEALRTYFENIEDQIVQKIDNNYEFKLEYETSDQSIEEITNNFVKPFDLEEAPLFRAKIIEIQGKNYLLIDMHHIISDGVSMSILINEFATLYNGGSLDQLKLQYKDFAAWQNNFLKSQNMKKQEEYWINMFHGEIPILNMPTDYERPAVKSFEGDSVSFELDKNIAFKIKELTKKTETTMHMVLLSAFNVLLAKYSGQEDIVIGTPIAGRPHADLQNIMGMFVNTLALRNKPEGTKKYIDFLNEVKENSLKAYDNQCYQLETLIEKLDIVRDTSRNPLFDVMFNMVDTVSDIDIKLNDMSLISYGSGNNVAKFDLILNAIDSDEKLSFTIQYWSKLFKKETIERLSNHYVRVLETIISNNEIELCNIDLLSDQERNQILYDFNDTKTDYISNSTIQKLFEAQVEKTPDNIAVIFEDKKLTYKELNEKSNSLAIVLRDKGIKPNSIVAIMVERSLEMAIGIMGILKSGAAYLPIDPTYPQQRIEYMLEDSMSKVLLSKETLSENLKFHGEVIDLYKDNLFKGNLENLENLNNSSDLAYVIYTSGTTGKPKGVLINHQALAETLLWRKQEYKLSESHVILPIFNYVFDGFVINFFTPIISGSKVVLVNNYEMADPYKLINYIRTLGVTHYISVPSIYLAILSVVDKNDLENLEVVTLAGEKMPPKAVDDTKKLKDTIEIVNEYGPTENTVVTTIMRAVQSDKKISIGKPIANTKVYILNSSNKMQPIGVPGEVFIGGSRLAKGYLNRPELDAERFIESFYDEGERLYKTGDFARWLPDGSIDFIDRIDNQVKIRGFRIELGEIENVLSYHEDVKEAAVLVMENNEKEKHICAYVVSEKEIDILNLKGYLKENLPLYMVPTYFVKLDKMPITSNGKIDRKSLPKPNLEEKLTTYEAPRNELEEALVKIWKDVLGVERIGINDNFFEVGGHSLKATKLISRINKEFKCEVSIKDVFNKQTIKELASFIGQDNRNSNISNGIHDNVVLLKKSDNHSMEQEEHLFVIHDGSGDIGGYIELASNLKGNIKCWGIKIDKNMIYDANNFTIEDLSQKYINIVKNIQPKGSYNIAGWSLGGVIAFEMVRQLEKNNEQIKNLLLIDSYINPKLINYNKLLKEDVSLQTEKMNLISYISDGHVKERICKESNIDKKWDVARKSLSKLELDQIKLRVPKEFTSVLPNIGEFDLDELVCNINIVRRLSSALKAYKPKNRVKKQAVLYKAKEESELNIDKWNKCFENNLVVDEVSGTHYTIVSGCNVEYISDRFNELL